MSQEIELKLTLPAAEQRRFLRSPVWRGLAARQTALLHNIYYDTPDLALHCNGIALRLRRSGRQWLQTVKCAGSASGGLSSRPEWEAPYGGDFDFSSVDDPATRKRLEQLRRRLAPVFETNFQRITWKASIEGTDLIVALDRGSIAAEGRTAAISEVEIELNPTGGPGSGDDIDRLFAFASRLMQDIPLAPGIWSKAERGYRLYLNTPPRPARAAPVPLEDALPPVAAFRRIAESCLNHLQLNHDGGLHSNNPEYIHQMRVAVRRLRAALRLFHPLLPAWLDEQLAPSLRALMRTLGEARDLDVLTADIINPVVAAMPAEPRVAALAAQIAGRLAAARRGAVQTLSAPGYGQTLLQTMMLLHRLCAGDGSGALPLPAFASARLGQLRRKVVRRAQAARQDDPGSLHELRIATKRLRYALEFFVPLLPARRIAALIQQLSRLQDALGQLNDLASAGTLLMQCAGDDAGLREAVSLIGGWHGQRHADLLAQVPQTLKTLRKLRLPKEKKHPEK